MAQVGRKPHARDKLEELLRMPNGPRTIRQLALAIYGTDGKHEILAAQRLVSRLREVKPWLKIHTVTKGRGVEYEYHMETEGVR